MSVPIEKARMTLEVCFPALEEINSGRKCWNFGSSLRFGSFKDFQQPDWLDYEIVLHEEIKANFISVERDAHGSIVRGCSGLTVLQSKQIVENLNGALVTRHVQEYFGFLTLSRMWKLTQDEYFSSFQKSSLDAISIASGFDGMVGALSGVRIDGSMRRF